MGHGDTAGRVILPTLASAVPHEEAVLFACDDKVFPFLNQTQVHLIPGQNPRIVLRPGAEGSHDEVVLYYGTVIKIGDTFHMWYNGNYGPLQNTIGYERVNCVIAYATSVDGVNWVKPDLGLVDFNGSRHNNIVDLPAEGIWSTCGVVYDPEDPNPDRRYKMAYEARLPGHAGLRFCVAFSPDGFRWTPSSHNPVGPFLEMSGVAKYRGLYYCNGQPNFGSHHQTPLRRLATFASADFEHWSPCSALGLDRGPDLTGPSMADQLHSFEEIHLGAALWNRGNVVVGVYGQWHGHFSGDRRWVIMDLGLALSHDAIHFHEPIPGFRIVPAREQAESPIGIGPSLMQGQGMENLGEQTLYWYSLWRGTEGSGVRLVTWGRDRISMLKPFAIADPRAITCPIEVLDGQPGLFVNVSGLGEHSHLRVELVDEGFRPIPGFSGEDAAVIRDNGFRTRVEWRGGNALPSAHGRLRVDVCFAGVRPEDCRLHALYLGTEAALA